jgi:curved DNA-binding protein CbpA
MSDENYYDELRVEPGASRDEIRDAHRARIEDLEAARDRKGITDAQLQQNREEVARVRKAWNVLSDPYQRGRYDQRISAPETGDQATDDRTDDDSDGSTTGSEVELTGWRKLLAPPPPKNGTSNGGAAKNTGTRDRNPTTGRRPRPEPTIVLPDGMRLAEPRNRGMALLFDLAVCLVIFTSVNLFVPGLLQSDFKSTQDKISKLTDLHDAQNKVIDAQSSLDSAKSASDKASATKDLNSAQKDANKAAKDARNQGVSNPPATGTSTKATAKATQTQIDKLGEHNQTTTYVTALIVLLLMLLYLVPICARTGQTLGMRRRRLKVVRINGAPVGWYASFTRFLIPLLFAVAIPQLGALIGLGIVGWAYFDKNRQGLHDKLARTVVVDA